MAVVFVDELIKHIKDMPDNNVKSELMSLLGSSVQMKDETMNSKRICSECKKWKPLIEIDFPNATAIICKGCFKKKKKEWSCQMKDKANLLGIILLLNYIIMCGLSVIKNNNNYFYIGTSLIMLYGLIGLFTNWDCLNDKNKDGKDE